MPLFAVIFGDILGVLSYEDRDKAMSETIWYAMWFVLLGVFTVRGFTRGAFVFHE